MSLLKDCYPVAYDRICMHEFVLSLDRFKRETGVSALDVAKALLDYGMHPPTMYFPLIVHEALMLEPTETETKETSTRRQKRCAKSRGLREENPEAVHSAPKHTPVGRLDEVAAARKPKLKFDFGQ
jgi:glycine dehydrogenase subunit 2